MVAGEAYVGPVVYRVGDPDVEPPYWTFGRDHDLLTLAEPEDVPGTPMTLRPPIVEHLVMKELLDDPVEPGVVI